MGVGDCSGIVWYSYRKGNVKKNLKYKYKATYVINLWYEKETFCFSTGEKVLGIWPLHTDGAKQKQMVNNDNRWEVWLGDNN